jgi:hypothetical protein
MDENVNITIKTDINDLINLINKPFIELIKAKKIILDDNVIRFMCEGVDWIEINTNDMRKDQIELFIKHLKALSKCNDITII